MTPGQLVRQVFPDLDRSWPLGHYAIWEWMYQCRTVSAAMNIVRLMHGGTQSAMASITGLLQTSPSAAQFFSSTVGVRGSTWEPSKPSQSSHASRLRLATQPRSLPSRSAASAASARTPASTSKRQDPAKYLAHGGREPFRSEHMLTGGQIPSSRYASAFS